MSTVHANKICLNQTQHCILQSTLSGINPGALCSREVFHFFTYFSPLSEVHFIFSLTFPLQVKLQPVSPFSVIVIMFQSSLEIVHGHRDIFVVSYHIDSLYLLLLEIMWKP